MSPEIDNGTVCRNTSNLKLTQSYNLSQLRSIIRYNYKQIEDLPEIDYRAIFKEANYSKLDKNYHATKLISKFYCHEKALQLLIVVTSNVSDFDRRETIRLTWGKQNNFKKINNFRVFFVMGKSYDNNIMNKSRKERELYGDIIVGDYFEKFYNLPYKFETIFEWAYKYCDFQYLLKTDDDVFINLPNLFKLLNSGDMAKKNIYTGRAQFFPIVQRGGKYKVSSEEYSTARYPPFVGGGAVIFSHDVVQSVLPYLFKLPFKLDDVYVAMLVANAGVKATHEKAFRIIEPHCRFLANAIAIHFENRKMKNVTTCVMELFHKMRKEDMKTNLNKFSIAR